MRISPDKRDERLLLSRKDRHSTDPPSAQDGLPALPSAGDGSVLLPHGIGEHLDPGVHEDGVMGKSELEPGAPDLRVEDPVSRSEHALEGVGESRGSVGDLPTGGGHMPAHE